MKYPVFVAEVNEAFAPNTAKPQVNAGTMSYKGTLGSMQH